MSQTARYTLFLVMANMAIYLGVFVCWMLSGIFPTWTDNLCTWLALPSSFILLATKPWTIVSYMFLHLNFLHLVVNMMWLLGFGGMMKSSGRQLVSTYLAGGIAGGVMYLLYTSAVPAVTAPLVGASSSVVAVVAATTILTPNRHVGILWFWEIKLKWLAPIALLTIFAGSTGAICAHAGGLATGLAAGLLLRHLDRRRSQLSLMKARKEMERRRCEAHKAAIIAKAAQSGFASLTDTERLEIFNLSKPASGE